MRNITVILFFITLCISKNLVIAQNSSQSSSKQEFANLKVYKSSMNYYGFRDSVTDNLVIDMKYRYAENFEDGLAKVGVGTTNSASTCAPKLYGYIDSGGREVIPCKYHSAWGFSEGIGVLQLDSTFFFFDKTGKELFHLSNYDHITKFEGGIARIREKNGGYGFIDKTGKLIIPCIYDWEYDYSNGLIEMKLNGKSVFFDTKGQKITKKQK